MRVSVTDFMHSLYTLVNFEFIQILMRIYQIFRYAHSDILVQLSVVRSILMQLLFSLAKFRQLSVLFNEVL